MLICLREEHIDEARSISTPYIMIPLERSGYLRSLSSRPVCCVISSAIPGPPQPQAMPLHTASTLLCSSFHCGINISLLFSLFQMLVVLALFLQLLGMLLLPCQKGAFIRSSAAARDTSYTGSLQLRQRDIKSRCGRISASPFPVVIFPLPSFPSCLPPGLPLALHRKKDSKGIPSSGFLMLYCI